jgi:hypothetical protein
MSAGRQRAAAVDLAMVETLLRDCGSPATRRTKTNAYMFG